MPRRVSRRRLVVAAVLVVLAVLPNVVRLRAPLAYRHNPQVLPAVFVLFLDYAWPVEVSSTERARWIDYRWEQFRRYSWILAAVAGLIVVREFLPVPRLFGRDED
jgi:hypothetical protein